jgi:hypothetical protein
LTRFADTAGEKVAPQGGGKVFRIGGGVRTDYP